VTRLHPAAQQGFARAAGEYRRGRPGYPAAAIEHLAERLDLGPGRSVVDLAAGTGALTRPLLALRCVVVAVEPVAEMRAQLPAGARALDGTAERIPLPDAVADAVTVAQAFHWFDGDAALAEIHRVLRPDGVLALIWNRRVLEDPVNAAIEELVAPHRGAPRPIGVTGALPSSGPRCSARSRSAASRTSTSRTPTDWPTGSPRSASSRRCRPRSANASSAPRASSPRTAR
jgi:SAM-dependent methyltransferase